MYHDFERRGRIVGRREAIAAFPSLTEELWDKADQIFPVRITRSWFNRILHENGPLYKQSFPDLNELISHPDDLENPVGELSKMPNPWVVQKHADRILLLTTKRCHFYCRYCFRRTHDGPLDPSDSELEAALDFILSSDAQEVILSGGDPLACQPKRLKYILSKLREKPIIRIHTRAPITEPSAVNSQLIQTLKAHAPIWLVVHCNHPEELNEEVSRSLAALADSGIPLLNQSVLLKGVNDDPVILEQLSTALLNHRVFPYYLHHTDAVTGNSSFRVELERGVQIYNRLRTRVSGIACPRYVIDPPDGSGKIDVLTYVQRRYNGHS
ncbi:MAG: KamA family radical SAM protein [Myxococcota bacterium]